MKPSRLHHWAALTLFTSALLAGPAWAASPPGSAELVAAQRQAVQSLALLDGTWRGPAIITHPDGSKQELIQTERVGNFLGGSIKVIEGRGHAADGSIVFNAMAVLAFEPGTGRWNFRSYTFGRFGDYPFEARPDGFAWRVQAGPATIHYVATVKDGVWHEVGDLVMPGRPPQRMIEMTLKRIGDSDWPAAGAVPLK